MATSKSMPAPMKTIELNRWCVEMAMRWPVVHVPASAGNFGHQQAGLNQLYQQVLPARDIDADVIGRAMKIKAWVMTTP